MRIVNALWYGKGAVARAARYALAPASWIYSAGVTVRNRRYDDGVAVPASLPVLSVGNLTVGGTGKTPITAWAAAALRTRGGTPAVVMRGYGDDEPLVHARLNPAVTVIVDGDRVRGAAHARDGGADCVILDDGFQHRRITRVSDWVLFAAEQWREDLRVLPSGPLREPLAAVARADVLLVTRKTATRADAEHVGAQLTARFPHAGVAVCLLTPDALVNAHTGERRALVELSGRRVVAVAGVAAPIAFFSQLRSLNATVTERAFPDHHRFSAADARALAALGASADMIVCTLKDAVKLGPLWPPAVGSLWYVSQIAVIEQGRAVLDHALESVLAARQPASITAGSAGPSSPGHGHRSSTAD